jgi:hypothetical protein
MFATAQYLICRKIEVSEAFLSAKICIVRTLISTFDCLTLSFIVFLRKIRDSEVHFNVFQNMRAIQIITINVSKSKKQSVIS